MSNKMIFYEINIVNYISAIILEVLAISFRIRNKCPIRVFI